MAAVSVKPGEAEAILDTLGIEGLCDLIAEGKSQRLICAEQGVERGSLRRWLALDPERQRMFDLARVEAADGFVDMAEEVLLDKTMDSAIRRDLAHHYRWKATKANVQRYGEKVAVDQTTTVVSLPDEEIARRIAAIRAKLEAGQKTGG